MSSPASKNKIAALWLAIFNEKSPISWDGFIRILLAMLQVIIQLHLVLRTKYRIWLQLEDIVMITVFPWHMNTRRR